MEMKKLHVIKIGGNIIDDPQLLDDFLNKFNSIKDLKILVHGGGKLATNLADLMGVKQTMIEGRRITDLETLNITVMVYAGLINKTIVAKLQAKNCNAIGYSGADGNLIRSEKRVHTQIDYGYVGDIIDGGVDVQQFRGILSSGLIPIICPITHDGSGNLLNTNADTMASKIASELATLFEVTLTFCFEKNGVLMDVENDSSFLQSLNKEQYLKLKSQQIISKGMIPKLDNAFEALNKNVKSVTICNGQHISDSENQITGTKLVQS